MLRLLICFYIASVITFLIFIIPFSVDCVDAIWEEYGVGEMTSEFRISASIGFCVAMLFMNGIIPILNIYYVLIISKNREAFIDMMLESIK